MDHILLSERDTDQLTNDIIAAFREQVRLQNEELTKYRTFLRRLRRYTPHKWLKDEIDELLKEGE